MNEYYVYYVEERRTKNSTLLIAKNRNELYEMGEIHAK